jgi:hypothetical protein
MQLENNSLPKEGQLHAPCGINSGNEKGLLAVDLLRSAEAIYFHATYRCTDGKIKKGHWCQSYLFPKPPAELTQSLVRLGTSDKYMRLLRKAYREILSELGTEIVVHVPLPVAQTKERENA